MRYVSLAQLGIDPATLDWHPMPETSEKVDLNRLVRQKPGITIAEAKIGLAANYGVKPEAVEITIRG